MSSTIPHDKILLNEKGRPLCSARKSKCRKCDHKFPASEYDLWECPECNEDRRCRLVVKKAGLRCKRQHGGNSPKGVAHPRFQTGDYSKYVPSDLVETYAESQDDAQLLLLREEIALVRTRVKQLTGRLGSGGGTQFFTEVKRAKQSFDLALRRGDEDAMSDALDNLDTAIAKGAADYQIWSDIDRFLGRLERLISSERKREIEVREIITLEQVATWFARFQIILLEELADDRAKLNRIIERIEADRSRPEMIEVEVRDAG